MAVPTPIDIDDESTWPEQLRDLAQVETPAFLGQGFEWEGRALRTCHATCLFPHEAAEIKRAGMHVLTRDSLEGRIRHASRLGCFGSGVEQWLLDHSTFAQDRAQGRTGVWSMLGRRPLADPSSVEGLMCCWGGEALHGHDSITKNITSRLGATPSIVILDQVHGPGVRIWDLPEAFRERRAGHDWYPRDVMSSAGVSADEVVDVVPAAEAASSGRFPELAWITQWEGFR